MPFQVNGQAVRTKSSRLLHVAGCDRAFVVVAGAAFAAMMSSADASVAYAAPASPRMIAVGTPNFFMLAPLDRGRSGLRCKRPTLQNMSRAGAESGGYLCARQCKPSRPPYVKLLPLH